jgi:membrane protein required for beta-lactamase induction
MSFLDFIFYPTIVATIVAVIIEQIVRRISNPEWNDDQKLINTTMRIRKFFYRQSIIINVLWFLGYAILMLTVGRQQPAAMPDMIWQG